MVLHNKLIVLQSKMQTLHYPLMYVHRSSLTREAYSLSTKFQTYILSG